jgi:hypothetical protein
VECPHCNAALLTKFFYTQIKNITNSGRLLSNFSPQDEKLLPKADFWIWDGKK